MSPWRVRVATIADVTALAELAQLGHHTDWDTALQKAREAVLQEDPPLEVLAAEVDHEVVAYARVGWLPCLAPDDPRCVPEGHYLLGLFVHPRYRRSGLGAQLIEVRLDHLRRRHPDAPIRYFRDFDNAASERIHARYGFTIEREDVWAPGLREPTKRLVLERADPRA